MAVKKNISTIIMVTNNEDFNLQVIILTVFLNLIIELYRLQFLLPLSSVELFEVQTNCISTDLNMEFFGGQDIILLYWL